MGENVCVVPGWAVAGIRTGPGGVSAPGKGVFRSIDGGSRFWPAGLQWSNRNWTLVFDTKTDPPTLYYGGEGGVLKTTSGGRRWT